MHHGSSPNRNPNRVTIDRRPWHRQTRRNQTIPTRPSKTREEAPMMIDLRADRAGAIDLAAGIPPGTGELEVILSCNDIWLLDHGRRRFRRIPRHAPISFLAEVGHWEPYDHLEADPDSDGFTLVLPAAGANRIRSYRHTQPCAHCDEGDEAAPER